MFVDIVIIVMMYKRVDKKVKLVDNVGLDGSIFEGDLNWKVRRWVVVKEFL